MYRVIKSFADMADDGHVYKKGNKYPRKGAKVSEERISELASSDNKTGEPLIKKQNKR